jgi:hypothetical protein
MLHKHALLMQVLSLDSTYQDAQELLAATEASQHGLDRHGSNGIYLDMLPVPVPPPDLQLTPTPGAPAAGAPAGAAGLADGGAPAVSGTTASSTSSYTSTSTNNAAAQTTLNLKRSAEVAEASDDDDFGGVDGGNIELRDTTTSGERRPLLGSSTHRRQSFGTIGVGESERRKRGSSPKGFDGSRTRSRSRSSSFDLRNASVQHGLHGQVGVSVNKYYAPNVIPIVQSRESMVIVGAVLRKDIKESLHRLSKLNKFACSTPVSMHKLFSDSTEAAAF